MPGKQKSGATIMRRIIPVLILLILIGSGYYWWMAQNSAQARDSSPVELGAKITGSGSIEAETIAIASETGGRIVAMHADEGDEVHRGDLLEAALVTARANLAEVSAAPRAEDVAAAEAELQQAKATHDGSYTVWQEMQSIVKNPLDLKSRIDATRGQVAILEKQVEAAQATLKEATIQRDEAARNQLNDEAITRSQVAAKQAEAAQANLDATEAELAGSQRQLALLIALQNKPLALIARANAAQMAYQQAGAAEKTAEAKLAAVKAGPRPEEVAIAQAKVQQAEAALSRLQVQLDKMTLTAPRDGIVTERPANPGELAALGATLMNLGDLDRLTLTVFIPETQIGRVRVGQTAHVTVDAYPGQVFKGMVTFITMEAEFTPKNVQTKEERVNLVFAAKISLDNPDHRLKPGMPADADIISDL
jgi:HlyD family secretion protein